MSDLAEAIVERIRATLGPQSPFVPLHEPCFEGNEQAYVTECIATGWVSSVGKFVDRFERDLACFTTAKHAVAIVNGTCALHLALRLAGVHPGDEVIVPALSFVATANAVMHLGAVPHFADSDETTLGMDPEKLGSYLGHTAQARGGVCYNRKTGRRIAAIVPMHAFGHPVRMHLLIRLAKKYDLAIVEDAAESLGSWYDGRHTGLWGQLGVLSFNGNKTITTGGGGAILTDSENLAQEAKHLSTQAKQPHPWEFYHDAVGYNYRMPNLNAALGCAQLEKLPGILERKRSLAQKYASAFADLAGVRFIQEPALSRSNYWLCTIKLLDRAPGLLEQVLELSNAAGFGARPAWRLLSELPMYDSCPRADLRNASSLAQSLINLPSSPGLNPR